MVLWINDSFTRNVFAIQYHGGKFIGPTEHKIEYEETAQNSQSTFVIHSIEHIYHPISIYYLNRQR